MCLIHDLGECFTGDIPTFKKTDNDRAEEEEKLNDWLNTLPVEIKGSFSALFQEMKMQRTPSIMKPEAFTITQTK